MILRRASDSDWPQMWPIFEAIVATGTSYGFVPGTSAEEGRPYWFGPDIVTWVVEDDGRIVGFYKMTTNRTGLGSHVANASFMVDPECRGKRIGETLGRHCLREAKRAGYLAMQFNFVVSTNTAAVALWEKLGFAIVGTVPKAYRHSELGLVDTYVMHRFLDDINVE
jgi:ribosomal protein S18 acetylase RimI-like enzyme